MCVAPTLPSLFSRCAIAMPIMFSSARHQPGRVRGNRLGERRQPDARRKRRRLVVHVNDVRLPLPPRVLHDARLDRVEHVGVAVVVVADVLLIEPRQIHALRFVRRADARHVVVGDHRLAVGIDRRPQHQDHVVEHRLHLGLVGAGSPGRRAAAACAAGRRLHSSAGRRRCGRTPCPRARAAARPRRSALPDAPAAARSRGSGRPAADSRRTKPARSSTCGPACSCRPPPASRGRCAASTFWK